MVRPTSDAARGASAAAWPVAGWIGAPNAPFAIVFAPVAAQQRLMLQAWLAWLDLLAAPWQPPEPVTLPDSAYRAMSQTIRLWWAPWTPLLQRGGEELG